MSDPDDDPDRAPRDPRESRGEMAFELVATLSLVLANAFFVGSEFAVARLRPTQVAEPEREGAAGARSVRHAIEHIDSYFSACQLGRARSEG